MEAWLIIWEWGGSHAKVDYPIAGILPAEWSTERVCAIVEAIYQYSYSTTGEKIDYVKNPNSNPYPAKIHERDEVMCGHNPWLAARRVSDLEVTPKSQDSEIVTWVEVRANGENKKSVTLPLSAPGWKRG
jgi:hypothetical protein